MSDEPRPPARFGAPRPGDERYRRRELTPKEIAFVGFLLGEARGNRTQAARLAGYKDPAIAGYKAYRRPRVRALIDEKINEYASPDEILTILTRHAFASITDFNACWYEREETVGVDKHGNPIRATKRRFDLAKAKDLGLGPLIKEVSEGKSGDQLKLHDVQGAATLLGKFHGMWKEKIINEDVDLSSLTDEQLGRLLKKNQG